ncbi:hypothetical protein AXF42_Ash016211 [Apostasia shenzhenica]|uniref:HTH La-type RNA-binding domain-containing protein n=1 Tax=Apostasia shenzhenica TaxID=1088818 RepID=A0A2I0AEW5_9ASPA|nr:hypothetical protein AXF42_Ash016211 [Apostasia shenzhenica]
MASAVDPAASPRSSRANRCLTSPWSHVVRGEHDSSAATPSSPSAAVIPSGDSSGRSPQNNCAETQPQLSSESTDHASDGNATVIAIHSTGKKPAWNVPYNGSNEGGAVMDAADWPALSESARASPKSSSDSLKALSDGSSSSNMGSLSSSSKPAPSNTNPNSDSNTTSSSRHKTVKRGAVIGSSSGNGVANSALSTPSRLPVSRQAGQLVLDKQSTSENSPKGLQNRNSNHNNFNWDNGTKGIGVSQQTHGGNDNQRGYSGGRRGNNSHHNTYGNRRVPDRGGYDWNHRNSGRDARMQQMHQQWAFGPYVRPTTTAPQFIAPPLPPRHFSNMGFPDFSPFYYLPTTPNPELLRGFPFGPPSASPPPVMFWPAPDPMRDVLLNQIEYYFSPANLCRDGFLRRNMDEEGWVPIYVVAKFNRVRNLTNNIPYILDTMRLSSAVEIQGDKIRKRNDWRTWLMPPSSDSGVNPNPQSEANTTDDLTAKLTAVELNNLSNQSNLEPVIRTEAALASSSSGNFNSQLSTVRDSKEEGERNIVQI